MIARLHSLALSALLAGAYLMALPMALVSWRRLTVAAQADESVVEGLVRFWIEEGL